MSDSKTTLSAFCEQCHQPYRRWHSIKLEKISTESRHFAWDSGKRDGWAFRVVIGFWTAGFTIYNGRTKRSHAFWIGDLTHER